MYGELDIASFEIGGKFTPVAEQTSKLKHGQTMKTKQNKKTQSQKIVTRPIEFPKDGLATVSEACLFLNISRSYLNDELLDSSDGTIKRKIRRQPGLGRSVRVRWEELHDYVAKQ